MRQLVLDTETTGLKAEDGHRIIEFAALEMINRKLTGKYLHLYINPERAIDEGAMKVHGITDEQVADKPKFREVIHQIIEFIQDSELIIHNAKFDMGFLNYQFNLEGKRNLQIKPVDSYIRGVIDTLTIARQKYPGGRNNLDALCDRFKIDRASRDYHGALIDCRLLSDVYLALTREQINLLETEGDSSQLDKNHFVKLDTSGFNLIVVRATTEEEELHLKYLDELNNISKGQSVWFNQANV
ncbi:MAG: DNA polymerase III subunit epsilon [Burkholderiales bacterium]|nr:DNA polymerase III subunit epsilon [Burkholderiales bacterium]